MDELRFPRLAARATHTLVPRWLADAAGVGLGGAERRSLAVATTATDAIHPWPYSWGLLGQRSFVRYLTITFRAADFEFELIPVAS